MKKNLTGLLATTGIIALSATIWVSAQTAANSANFLLEEVHGNKALIFSTDLGPFELTFLNCGELAKHKGSNIIANFGQDNRFDDGDSITFSNGKTCNTRDVDSNLNEDKDLEGRYRWKTCVQAFGVGAHQAAYDDYNSCSCKTGYHWNLAETQCIQDPVITSNTTNTQPAAQLPSTTTTNTNSTTLALGLIEVELAKDALGAENITILDGIAKKIQLTQPATQAKIKTLIENFKISNDLATRYIGIYLSSLLG